MKATAETVSIYLSADLREGVEEFARRLRAVDQDARGSRSKAVRILVREGLKAIEKMPAVLK